MDMKAMKPEDLKELKWTETVWETQGEWVKELSAVCELQDQKCFHVIVGDTMGCCCTQCERPQRTRGGECEGREGRVKWWCGVVWLIRQECQCVVINGVSWHTHVEHVDCCVKRESVIEGEWWEKEKKKRKEEWEKGQNTNTVQTRTNKTATSFLLIDFSPFFDTRKRTQTQCLKTIVQGYRAQQF